MPRNPQAYVILGSLAQENRRFTEADLLFAKANDLLATSTVNAKRKQAMEPQALSGLAWVAEAREDWPTSQKFLESLLKVLNDLPAADGDDAKKNRTAQTADAMGRLARVLFQQTKAGEAYKMLKKAKDADPKDVLTPEATLAQLYEAMGGENNHKEAAKWMKFALKNAPGDLRTRLAVALLALNTGDVQMAKENAEKALEIDHNSLDAKGACGCGLVPKGLPRRRRLLRDALMQKPSAWMAKNNLALALCEQSDEQKKLRRWSMPKRTWGTRTCKSGPKSVDRRLGLLQGRQEAAGVSGHGQVPQTLRRHGKQPEPGHELHFAENLL